MYACNIIFTDEYNKSKNFTDKSNFFLYKTKKNRGIGTTNSDEWSNGIKRILSRFTTLINKQTGISPKGKLQVCINSNVFV